MKHVLIIEDDRWLAEQWAESCRSGGFETTIVKDGFTAIDAVDANKPDVIVLDLFLPGPNGIAFLHELRSHVDLANIPVVVTANSDNDIDEVHFRPYGVNRVMDKQDMTPAELVGSLRKITT